MQTTEICVALLVYPDDSVRHWMIGKDEETGRITPIYISEENAFNQAGSLIGLPPEREELDQLTFIKRSSWEK